MTAIQERDDLVAATVRFCRALRARGLPVTPAETIDAVTALDHIDITDRGELHRALRIVLVSRVEDLQIFDDVFDATWGAGRSALRAAPGRAPRPAHPAGPHSSLHRWARALGTEEEPVAMKAPSAHEALGAKDLRTLAADELDEIARLAARLARRLVARPSRRWRAAFRGSRVDPRRTMRRSLGAGGELVELARRERKIRKTSLVVLCDVSASMDLYARFFLQFVYALQNSFGRVESFVFATRLSRVTRHLRRQPYRGALVTLGEDVRDWSGGTRIGESLTTLETEWSALIDPRTIVVVMSDGWETGDSEQLSAVLARLRARAGKLVWLNPLLGSPTYRPLTGGMQAALPHIDVFAPMHNLESLRALVRHLRLGQSRRRARLNTAAETSKA
jgi:hypothetical protein